MTPQEALIWEKAYLWALQCRESSPAKIALQAVADFRTAMGWQSQTKLSEPVQRMPSQEPSLG